MVTSNLVRALLLIWCVGCAATGATPRDAARIECSESDPCDRGFICAAVDGVPRCVADPDPPPPGDGTDCRPCPAPGECRMSVCVQPSPSGAFCEFDSVCPSGELCIAG